MYDTHFEQFINTIFLDFVTEEPHTSTGMRGIQIIKVTRFLLYKKVFLNLKSNKSYSAFFSRPFFSFHPNQTKLQLFWQ